MVDISAKGTIRVLVVEDDEVDYLSTQQALDEMALISSDVRWESNFSAALKTFAEIPFDVCILDYRLGAKSGLDFLHEATSLGISTPTIMLTGQGDARVDLDAMEAGAADYLEKDALNPELLERSIRYTLQNAAHVRRLEDSEAALRGLVDDLQRTHDEIESFTSIVGHDLRAPLRTISGFTGILQKHLDEIEKLFKDTRPSFPKDRQERLEKRFRKDIPDAMKYVSSSILSMEHMIGGILKLSRLGRQDLTMGRVSTEEAVSGVLRSLAFQIEEAGVEFSTENLPIVLSDRTAVEQIFANLIGNALKYLVSDRRGRIRIWAEQRGDETVFHVSDNGRGMEERDIPRAFQVFQRVGEQDVEGEGMGLAYVNALIRRLGGRIWCESALNEGSTFTFTLPNRGD